MRYKASSFCGLPLALALLASQAVFGSNHMTDSHKSALESVGVPVYPGATFLTSDDSSGVALWFSSSDSPDTIMDWYEHNLTEWSAATIGGTRVIYKGPAGLGQEEIMALPYVYVTSAQNLGKAPGNGNEITVHIPVSP